MSTVAPGKEASMNAEEPDPFTRDLDSEVPEADAADQTTPVSTDDLEDGPADLPETSEADPADVWDQAQVVGEDEEERDRA